MILKYYGLYDSVAQNMVNIFTAQNDEVCVRSMENMVKDPKTDINLIKDCIVKYLYSVDSETGDVVDNTKRDVAVVATIMEKCYDTVDPKSYADLLAQFNEIKEKFNTYKELDSKCLKILDVFGDKYDRQFAIFNKFISDIKGGKIECLKYNKSKLK